MGQTFTRGLKRCSAFSDPLVKSSNEKDTSVRFHSEQFRAKLDRNTSFYLLFSPQTKGDLFLSSQVCAYLVRLRIGRITAIALIPK